jgi:hypothetical protein
MRLPQFSLKALAGAVAFAAVACCSLIYASSTWSATIYTSAIVLLIFALLATLYRQGAARAFWAGCAISGWVYLLLVFGPFSGTRHLDERGRLNRNSELATAHLARWAYETVLPKLRQQPPNVVGGFFPGGMSGGGGAGEGGMFAGGMPGMAGGFGGGVPVATTTNYPDETSFIRVSHALWTWLFALAGGIMASWLYAKRRSLDEVRRADS